ncbi:MAG: AAA family ATPase, partial [Firmicutes bacterium]|nr:AAA family ATPase [Bacillota bacterium]
VINALLNIFEGNGHRIAVAAPTGRAAKRVMETSGRFACTVHRLLEYYYDEETGYMCFGRNAAEPLDVNAVIIDEASMLDLMLMEALCDAIKPGTRLILVGDADQLPSVGAGNVLADLIDSEYFFTAHLTEIHRQSAESRIVTNAHRINHGDEPSYGGDFMLVPGDKQQEILEKIASIAARHQLSDVQVLTPTKKGILGSVNLNERLQQVFNPSSPEKSQLEFGSKVFRVGDRVMQIKNNYRLECRVGGETVKGVFNGEIGIIKGVDKEMRSVTVLYDDERWAEYPYVQLDEIELAYAVTVHKSQGSEFPVVILPMTWFPPVLATRSLLYTAVTRGKKQVIIVGRPDYLAAMAQNNQSRSRNSGLKDRLTGLYQMF